jgi:hypothetical protein
MDENQKTFQVLKGRIENYSAIRHGINFASGPCDWLESARPMTKAITRYRGIPDGENPESLVDWVSFNLSGGIRVDGWLWREKFKNGDQVDVVAEMIEDNHYRLWAVLRPADRLIVLFPHLRRGRRANIYGRIKSWFICVHLFLLFMFFFVACVIFLGDRETESNIESFVLAMTPAIALTYVGSIGLCLSEYGRHKRFSVLSECVFKALGWRDVENIDLAKIAKKKPLSSEVYSFEYAYFYFRY